MVGQSEAVEACSASDRFHRAIQLVLYTSMTEGPSEPSGAEDLRSLIGEGVNQIHFFLLLNLTITAFASVYF